MGTGGEDSVFFKGPAAGHLTTLQCVCEQHKLNVWAICLLVFLLSSVFGGCESQVWKTDMGGLGREHYVKFQNHQ